LPHWPKTLSYADFHGVFGAGVPQAPQKKKSCKTAVPQRSLDVTIVKKLRMIFYLAATVELVLISIAWGRLPLH
jgi:hypothetical protein